MSKSKIEWTEWTWNPTTGCSKVSPGCKNCYAESMAVRLKAMRVKGYENGFDISILPERLEQPLKRKKPSIFFVNSMSDLFHEDIPDSFIIEVFEIIKKAKQHKFQILTKRSKRLLDFSLNYSIPENAWMGVSVEDTKYGLPRLENLKKVKAEIKFISAEPLLEDLGELNLNGIHWVIVGGESGPKARPMKKEWVENIKAQCAEQKINFFFKQWGKWGEDGIKRSKKLNGRKLSGELWNEIPLIA